MKLVELIASREVTFDEVQQIRRMLASKGIPVETSAKFIPGITAPVEYGALDLVIAAMAGGFFGAIGTDFWQKLKAGISKIVTYLRKRPQFRSDIDPDVALIFGDGKENAIYVQIPAVDNAELDHALDKLATYLKKSKAKQQWVVYDKTRAQWKTNKSLPPRGFSAGYSLRDRYGNEVQDPISVRQASEWIGLSQSHVRYLLRTGSIDGIKSHGEWFIHTASLLPRVKSKSLPRFLFHYDTFRRVRKKRLPK